MSEESRWTPSVNPWLITAAVCLPTFMEVLDTTVANVALPHMAGSLAASNEEATWVLTSYLVANAIILPASAWLGTFFGRKRFLMTCIAIFAIASALCGSAMSLNILLLARVAQGMGGGALQPTSQAILFESFPAEKRGPAAAVYGLAIVTAPVIGPTLGGWITDNYSWRWIFYINVPIAVLALGMIYFFVEDPPYLNRKAPPLDVTGFCLLSIWISAFQILLDQGQLLDWFQSKTIIWLAVISVVFLVLFIWWELTCEDPLVDLSVLSDVNCASAAFFYTIMGIGLYGMSALIPLYLQGQMGYPAYQSGLTASPRGLGSVISMMIVGRLIARVDSRFLVCFGFLGFGASAFWLSHLSPEMAMSNIALPIFTSGLFVGFIFVPLTTLVTASLPTHKIGAATGITSLTRNLGGGIGISLTSAFVARIAQAHQNWMSAHITTQSPSYHRFHDNAVSLLSHHWGPIAANHGAVALTYKTLVSQSYLMAYVETLQGLGWVCMLCAPAILLVKRARPSSGAAMPMH